VAITKLIVSNSRNCLDFACCLMDGRNPPEFVEESESDGEGKESEASVEYEAEAAL